MVDKVGGTRVQMTNHLKRIGARYHFRRKIPLALQAELGKKEVSIALGTSDYAEAKRLAAIHTVRTDTEWAALLAPRHLDEAYGEQLLQQDDDEREWEADYAANRDWHEGIAIGAQKSHESTAALLKSLGLPTANQLAFYQEFGGFHDTDMPTREQAAKAAHVVHASAPLLSRFPTAQQASQPVSVSFGNSISLAALCERWAKERQPAARTIKKYELAVERFYTLVGRFPVDQITRRQVVEFKDKLVGTGVSIPNTNHTLDCLGTLLNFGCDNELIRDNVSKGIRLLDNRSDKSKRLPYTLDQLKTIFHKLPNRDADREGFWLPMLGLYTGARLGELCQLTSRDIREETYFDSHGKECRAWCIYITNEGEGKRVKTSSSIRRIPVHPALIAQGFIDFAQARTAAARIFDLEPNKDGEHGQDWSKVYGKFLRLTCGILDPRRVFHSFRHTFKEICRDCEIGKELADAMQGHSDGDSSDAYGGEFYPLRPLVRAMLMYQIKGLVLPERA